METSIELIRPVVALVIWSLIMWLWMYATRLPAIAAMKMQLDPEAPAGTQMSNLPPRVRWKADNYNHLMEQPTIFYAIVLCLVSLDAATEVNIIVSWVYVGLRVAHSLYQALVNKIEIRFVIFLLSNIPLFILAFNAANVAF
ncbi:MAPEG family protein [Microbulbifer sp. GL-2]|uniref:MAPEG family protein n=1 Tax=Microbulbifer sp. GL-2 TaxID=2591606 RepID=UPI00116462BF|nr:MAPEG family protein [Microbulbifer sp. GL-2]BBM03611.1 membrane protein [Microbulbifer sp. GL-2]